ncbi:adenylosuccinate synthetase, partial [Candidatus Hakubella thermalkaliphila]
GGGVGKNVGVGEGAALVRPYRGASEREQERIKGSKKIGTTGKGIGPVYVDKAARTGISVGELLYPEVFKEKLKNNLVGINHLLKVLYNAPAFDLDDIYSEYMRYAERLSDCIADTDIIVKRMIDESKNLLLEGAQGILLDVDHGTYPYVTSSIAAAGGACRGLGVGPTQISCSSGICRAYLQRVG